MQSAGMTSRMQPRRERRWPPWRVLRQWCLNLSTAVSVDRRHRRPCCARRCAPEATTGLSVQVLPIRREKPLVSRSSVPRPHRRKRTESAIRRHRCAVHCRRPLACRKTRRCQFLSPRTCCSEAACALLQLARTHSVFAFLPTRVQEMS